MSVNGIGGSGAGYAPVQQAGGLKADAVQEFMDYMKKPAMQRMQEAWLAAHGYTKEKLADMTPEQREAVFKQMAEEVKQRIRDEAAKKRGGVDIIA